MREREPMKRLLYGFSMAHREVALMRSGNSGDCIDWIGA